MLWLVLVAGLTLMVAIDSIMQTSANLMDHQGWALVDRLMEISTCSLLKMRFKSHGWPLL